MMWSNIMLGFKKDRGTKRISRSMMCRFIRPVLVCWVILFCSSEGYSDTVTAVVTNKTSPQIWFAPLDPMARQTNVKLGIIPSNAAGRSDFMNLFSPEVQWTQAAAHVSVFKLYTDAVLKLSDTDLHTVLSFLKQHNIDIAIEFGPLTVSGDCGVKEGLLIEGFSGWAAQQIVDKFHAHGATLKYVAMDEPFYFGNIYPGPGACHWSARQIAENAATSLNILKNAFPGLIVGDIEVVPVNNQLASDWVERYAAWMDAFQAVTGSKLAFFHADVITTIPTWMSDLTYLRTETSKRGISFGIIYNGLPADSSDTQWLTHAQQLFTAFELSRGQPDQAIFQSWLAYPITSLPDTTPYTFTWLINQYTRQRTSISLTAGPVYARGKLVDGQGQPIPSAPITVSLQPTSGPGILSNYALSGTVPASITKALIQICVNKYGCQNTNDMSVFSFRYADSGKRKRLDFSNGLSGWWVDDKGTALVQPRSDSNGKSLHISATAFQQAVVNSTAFAVTPGSTYNLTVQAKISPVSVGSGYFALIFLVDKEVSRDILPYIPGTVRLGTAQTNSDGVYNLHFDLQNSGSFQIRSEYAGNDVLWPALASASLDINPSKRSNYPRSVKKIKSNQ
jgi:hypothetical protein